MTCRAGGGQRLESKAQVCTRERSAGGGQIDLVLSGQDQGRLLLASVGVPLAPTFIAMAT